MRLFDAMIVIDEGTDDWDEYVEAFQLLSDSGLARTLPGRYGRELARLVENGDVIVNAERAP